MRSVPKKIMIINPCLGEMSSLIQILSRFDYRVSWKSSAETAFMALRAVRFDLIIVMDNLLDMSGLEFISKIKCRRYRKKIIYLSNQCQLAERNQVASAGAGKYVHRSICFVDLAVLIFQEMSAREKEICLN